MNIRAFFLLRQNKDYLDGLIKALIASKLCKFDCLSNNNKIMIKHLIENTVCIKNLT